jgi:hypothetical protein
VGEGRRGEQNVHVVMAFALHASRQSKKNKLPIVIAVAMPTQSPRKKRIQFIM